MNGIAGNIADDPRQVIAALRRDLELRTAERDEALAREAAAAEILQVINSSPGDLAPVFESILEKAHSLCGVSSGGLIAIEGEKYRPLAVRGEPSFAEYWLQQGWIQFSTGAVAQLRRGEPVHITDVTLWDGLSKSEQLNKLAELSGTRVLLMVPLYKDDVLFGAITALRNEVRPFTDKEIALLQNFAAQAVIAMENARLITETREALEQQTATAEVLQVINSSPGDLAPVFDAMLEKATRLCGASLGTLWEYDGQRMHPLAMRGVSREYAEYLSNQPLRPGAGALGSFVRGETILHVVDLKETEAYRNGDAHRRALVDLGGGRSLLGVPLRTDDRLRGAFLIYRREPQPFTDKQIALLQNFAAQAVIAMENARLLTETREALAQQTATAEVLSVINSSPGDLAPVFDAILEKAHRLCGVAHGSMQVYDGRQFRAVAVRGLPDEIADRLRKGFEPGPEHPLRGVLDGERFVHIRDLAEMNDAHARFAAERGSRTLLAVPLKKEGALLGQIVAVRQEVRPFSDKEIALLENFAAQAVIAMENARLLTETREALAQQTATAEVLQVINSSPGELAPVFDAMLEKAMALCEAAFGGLWSFDDDRYVATALRGVPDQYAQFLARTTQLPGPGSAPYRFLHGERAVIQNLDLADEELYRAGDPQRRALVDLGRARTALQAPLVRDDVVLGVITIYRQEKRPFTDKQIALLQNFAAQAVIAMENARLLTETREALEQQTATSEVLQVINASPGDLAPVFDAILEKAHTLCGAAHGSLTLAEGEHFRAVAMRGMPEELARVLRQPFHPGVLGERLSSGEPFVQIADIASTPTDSSVHRAAVGPGGVRTLLAVPLRKDLALLGYITANRQEARPFSDKQVALLQNFAAQAVIAMENARLLTETREALEQQTATAEVLQVINSSPGDLAPVFIAMLEKATKLCEASTGVLWTYHDGDQMRAEAIRGASPRYAEFLRQGLRPLSRSHRRLSRGERYVHIHDIPSDAVYSTSELARASADLSGIRTILMMPLRKEAATLGAFCIYRQEVRPFTDKQVALLQNFAAQAVIAMENARLLTETREALAQQTATAEVLQVINSSPGNLAPVFDAMLEKAMRLGEAAFGMMHTFDGNEFNAAAMRGVPEAYTEYRKRNPLVIGPGSGPARIMGGESIVHIADLAADPAYRAGEAADRAVVELAGARSILSVPLRKEDQLLGMLTVFRQQVRPFSDKQIALLQNFAAQAVIAMENARLLTETREALEQQTATAEVLQVINSSPGDLAPVFDAMLEKAHILCGAAYGGLVIFDGEEFRPVAIHGGADFAEYWRQHPVRLPPGGGNGPLGGLVRGEHLVHFADVRTGEAYRDIPEYRHLIDLGGIRTLLVVSLRKDGKLLGAITAYRQEVKPFSDKQIALLQNFAAQAVIAMENARLLGELRQRTAELGRSVDELTMLSEVGQAVSSTLDLRLVLATILIRSVALTGADAGAVFRYNRAERAFRLVEAAGLDDGFARAVHDVSIAEAETAMSEAAARRAPVQLADLALRPRTPLVEASLAAGLRSALIVPLVGQERTLGALVLQRRSAGEFPPETVRLMQTLASQSVLAIQNARLFREIAEKSEELALASQHKSQFLANMSHELRTPLNAILGYAELLVDGIYGALPEKAQGVLERVQNNGKHLLALINDVLDLSKIEAGQLTLTLEAYNLPDVVRSVVTATEPLASAKGLKFAVSIEEPLPTGRGDARRLAQVLLNLVGNAIKFTDEGEVEIRAMAERGQFVLSVRDTGPGIADADQDRIFGEFQQIDNADTRKKGGTGLGLAISKRMVEMQGGMITVESELGRGSTFRVVLPVEVEPALEAAAE